MGFVRFVLALSVAVSHSSNGIGDYALVNAHAAVMLFFAISGFNMALIYENYKDSFSRFYLNRFLRLFPVFYFVIFYILLIRAYPYPLSITNMLLLLLAWAIVFYVIVFLIIEYLGLSPNSTGAYSVRFNSMLRRLILPSLDALRVGKGTRLVYVIGLIVIAVLATSTYLLMKLAPSTFSGAFLLVLANTTMIGADVIYTLEYVGVPLAPISIHLLIQPTWSVGIEEQYYLLSPLFHKFKVRMIFTFVAASIAIRFLIDHYFMMPATSTVVFGLTYSTLPAVLVFFLFGHLAFRLYTRIKDRKEVHLIGWISAVVVLLWFAYDVSQGKQDSKFFGWHFYSDIWRLSFHRGGTYGDLISYVPFVLLIPFWFQISRRSKIDHFFGTLSYPLYISHVFVITSVIKVNGWSNDSSLSEDLIIITVCIVAAVFLALFVEGHVMPLRDHVRGFARFSSTPKK